LEQLCPGQDQFLLSAGQIAFDGFACANVHRRLVLVIVNVKVRRGNRPYRRVFIGGFNANTRSRPTLLRYLHDTTCCTAQGLAINTLGCLVPARLSGNSCRVATRPTPEWRIKSAFRRVGSG
jgi:hypothetical protein